MSTSSDQGPAGRVTSKAAPDEALPIEEYALIGDNTTAALVGSNGSIDWLCWPRFDSAACFAALLGHGENGFWLIAPRALDGSFASRDMSPAPAGVHPGAADGRVAAGAPDQDGAGQGGAGGCGTSADKASSDRMIAEGASRGPDQAGSAPAGAGGTAVGRIAPARVRPERPLAGVPGSGAPEPEASGAEASGPGASGPGASGPGASGSEASGPGAAEAQPPARQEPASEQPGAARGGAGQGGAGADGTHHHRGHGVGDRVGHGAAEVSVTRSYRDGSLVLETVFTTPTGSVAVIDFMPVGLAGSAIVRLVEGRTGHVAMRMRLCLRFDYGMSMPWVTRLPDGGGITAIAGPEMVVLRAPMRLDGEAMTTVASFQVKAGQTVPFVLQHAASHLPVPEAIDPQAALADTDAHWRAWSDRSSYAGPYKQAVTRSLLTLKALTYASTGGIVAAATTSLPEQIGGGRNWDYRFCWLRDATLTLFAFMRAGYYDEAGAWRDWLHRALAGSPSQIQIMYGLAGERRLAEWEVPWLAGYQGAAPVRVGNAASAQLQLDVFGEVINALYLAREGGLRQPGNGWSLQRGIMEHLETVWQQPDEGMWEVRGGPQHFTLSKVMVWVAFDRAIRSATRHHLSGPLEHWQALRDQVHAEICERGMDPERGCFVQSYGSKELDASLLLIPKVGFLPAGDPRVKATVRAIEEDLLQDGFVLRYRTTSSVDGLKGDEGAFLACTFWLVDAYSMQGRHEEARALFDRLMALRNDVGLLSEEYDPRAKRLVGNFPQAFSHVAMIASAMTLGAAEAAADRAVAAD